MQIASLIENKILPAAQVICHREEPQKCAIDIVKKEARVLPKIK